MGIHTINMEFRFRIVSYADKSVEYEIVTSNPDWRCAEKKVNGRLESLRCSLDTDQSTPDVLYWTSRNSVHEIW